MASLELTKTHPVLILMQSYHLFIDWAEQLCCAVLEKTIIRFKIIELVQTPMDSYAPDFHIDAFSESFPRLI